MKPSSVATLLAGLVGVSVAFAEDISGMDDNLERLVGQQVDVAIARLRSPKERRVVDNGDVVYRWRFWIQGWNGLLSDTPACEITLTTDATTKVIERNRWKGAGTTCAGARRKLAVS
jgi:hypothetical protein